MSTYEPTSDVKLKILRAFDKDYKEEQKRLREEKRAAEVAEKQGEIATESAARKAMIQGKIPLDTRFMVGSKARELKTKLELAKIKKVNRDAATEGIKESTKAIGSSVKEAVREVGKPQTRRKIRRGFQSAARAYRDVSETFAKMPAAQGFSSGGEDFSGYLENFDPFSQPRRRGRQAMPGNDLDLSGYLQNFTPTPQRTKGRKGRSRDPIAMWFE